MPLKDTSSSHGPQSLQLVLPLIRCAGGAESEGDVAAATPHSCCTSHVTAARHSFLALECRLRCAGGAESEGDAAAAIPPEDVQAEVQAAVDAVKVRLWAEMRWGLHLNIFSGRQSSMTAEA